MRRFRSKRVSIRRPRKGRYGRSRYTRPRKLGTSRYYKLVRTVNSYQATVNAGQTVAFKATFQATDVPDHSNLKQYFDEFKIVKVKYSLYPSSNVAQANGNSGIYRGMGMIATCIDYNDDAQPSTMQEVLEYSTKKLTRSNRIHTRVFRPKAQRTIYNGLTSAYAPTDAWIPTQYSEVPHYAIKGVLEGGPGDIDTISYSVRVFTTYTIIYRAPR